VSLKLISSDKRFFPLFWTMFLGALNDNFFKNALIILITYRGISLMDLPSSALVAMAGGIFILPFFLFSATAGQLADKLSKTTLIRVTKITELFVMLVATLGFYTGNYLLLLVTLFLMGTQSTFFGPLKYGIIPQLLGRSELVTGNAFIGGGTFLAILIGTILGGLSISAKDPILVVSLGVMVVSVLGIIFSFFIEDVEPMDPEVKPDFTFVRPTMDILKLTMSDSKIFHTCIGISWFWFLGAAILSLLPALCKDIFYSSEKVGTMFLASFTIGMGIGSFFAERLSQRRPEVGMAPLALLGMSFFMFDLAYCGLNFSKPVSSELLNLSQFFTYDYSLRALIDLLFVSIFGGMYIIPQFTFLQDYTPRNILSRIIAGNNILNSLFMVSAAILIMVLASSGLNIPKIFIILAGLNFLFSFYNYYVNSAVTIRFISWFIAKIFYRISIEGRENIPESGSVIIAANHVSFIDWILISAASPRPVRFVIDQAFYFSKPLNFWFKQAHLIPIATTKESPEVLENAFTLMKEGLLNGDVLGLFPEGWITRDGQVRKFQPGIRKIVRMDPAVVVVPLVIKGLWGSFFSFEGKGVLRGISFKRRRVILKILPAIGHDEFDFKKLEAIVHEEHA